MKGAIPMMRRNNSLFLAALLAASTAAVLCLPGCASSSGEDKPVLTQSQVTPARVIADINGALTAIAQILPALAAQNPPVLPTKVTEPLLADIRQAQELVRSIGPGTPAQTGATVLNKAEGYLNAVLSVLATTPLPKPYSDIVLAANIIAPIVEAYIDSIVPPPVVVADTAVAAQAAKASFNGMTPEKARATLNIH